MENIKTMRKIKLLIIILLIGKSISAQTYKILNDPAIVGQHKRMVFQKWGDWYPKPVYKKILWVETGIQTNVAASALWGYNLYGLPASTNPFSYLTNYSRNRRYKNGADIRPLKPTGLQNQRLAEREIEYSETKKIKEQSEDLKAKSKRDFAHWTKLTVSADPLWLLYYKKMLKPLKNFPENPQSFADWQFSNYKVYEKLKNSGALRKLQEQLDVLKHNYKVARTVDMPRGKRILFYHKILIAWRKFEKSLKTCNASTKYALKVEDLLAKSKSTTMPQRKQTDTEIVREYMLKYKSSKY